MKPGLLDALLTELAADDERRQRLAELLAPEIAERLPPPDGWLDGRGRGQISVDQPPRPPPARRQSGRSRSTKAGPGTQALLQTLRTGRLEGPQRERLRGERWLICGSPMPSSSGSRT